MFEVGDLVRPLAPYSEEWRKENPYLVVISEFRARRDLKSYYECRSLVSGCSFTLLPERMERVSDDEN